MKICVLVKQVPNEDAVIKISPDGSGIIEDNLTFCFVILSELTVIPAIRFVW